MMHGHTYIQVKQSFVQEWKGPESSRMLSLPQRPSLPPRTIPGTHLC